MMPPVIVATPPMASEEQALVGVDNAGYRLPLLAEPVHYDLTVRTDLNKLEFDGLANIKYAQGQGTRKHCYS